MTKVYKFPLEISDEQKVSMPEDAKVLTVQVQKGKPCLWAECNPDGEPVLRTFLIRGTGHPIDDEIEKYAALNKNKRQRIAERNRENGKKGGRPPKNVIK